MWRSNDSGRSGGQYLKSTYGKTVFSSLEWLLKESGIGGDTLLRDVGPNKITQAIAKRRGTGVERDGEQDGHGIAAHPIQPRSRQSPARAAR
jgi:hypothetical protein